MVEARLEACSFRTVRFFPSLLREEFITVGIVMSLPGGRGAETRMIQSDSEFARVRRLHPEADLSLLRGLEAEFVVAAGEAAGGLPAITTAAETLSNSIQFGPVRAVLTENPAEELQRLYDEYVAPPRAVRLRDEARTQLDSPAAIRRRASAIFSEAGLLPHLRAVRAAAYTYPGDSMRIDFHWQNGAPGFAHSISLARDTAQPKALAFTAERIRAKLGGARFTAITDGTPSPSNERHTFVRDLFAEQQIEIVPIQRLEPWAQLLAHTLH